MQPNGVATLVDEGEALLIEGDRHIGDDTEKSLEYATDFAIAKPNTDLLFLSFIHISEPTTPYYISYGVPGSTKKHNQSHD